MEDGPAIAVGKESHGSASGGRSKYVILALLFIGWCLGNMDRLVMSYAVVPIGKEFGLNASVIGLVLSSFFFGYAFMQIPGGWLADRFGSRRVLLVIVFVWSIFTSLTGLAWSLSSLIVIRVLFGFAEGGFSSAAIKMLTETFPKKENGRAVSVLLMSAGLISIVVPILAGLMITRMGWRPMFYIIGAIGAVLVVLFFFFLKPRPIAAEPEAAAPAEGAAPQNMRELLKSPLIWTIAAVYFAVYTLVWGFNTWLPSYLVSARHLDLMSIGKLQVIPGIGMMVSILLGGVIVDKLKPSMCKSIAAICSAIVAILIYFMYTCSDIALFVVYQTGVSIVIGFLIGFLPAILVKHVPSVAVGSAAGITNMGGQLAGLATPFVMGLLVDAFKGSYIAAFCYLAFFAVVSLAGCIVLRTRKSVEATA